MGNTESVSQRLPSSIRYKNRESSVNIPKQPKPDHHEIERRFNQVLVSGHVHFFLSVQYGILKVQHPIPLKIYNKSIIYYKRSYCKFNNNLIFYFYDLFLTSFWEIFFFL